MDVEDVFSSSDFGLFAGVIWAEAGFNRQDQVEVALSIANRWSIVNNYTYVWVPDDRYEGGRRYVTPVIGWGTPGHINNILSATSPSGEPQYDTVSGGKLKSDFQRSLNAGLNAEAYIAGTDELTDSCKKISGASATAMAVLTGLINNSYSAFRTRAMVTSFHHNPTPSRALGEVLLDDVGTRNVFAGIPWDRLAPGNGSPPRNRRASGTAGVDARRRQRDAILGRTR
jgi:hypothetical protein